MSRSDIPDPRVDPKPSGRLGRRRERGRSASARVEAARPQHATVDFGLRLFERDASIGGGLLAGALAYRLFVLLLPTTMLLSLVIVGRLIVSSAELNAQLAGPERSA